VHLRRQVVEQEGERIVNPLLGYCVYVIKDQDKRTCDFRDFVDQAS
jgi:hypothetical protein